MKKEMLDKYKGSMLGLAIGDALGATTEFMTYDEIRIQFVICKPIREVFSSWSMF